MHRLRLRNWSIRAKLASLLVAVSLVPLTLVSWLDIRETRNTQVAGMQNLLAARADQLAREFDSTHQGYMYSARRVARLPVSGEFCNGEGRARDEARQRILGVLKTFPTSDADIRGAGIIGPDGHMLVATEDFLVGRNFSDRSSVRGALAGADVISGVYLSDPAGGQRPTVAYLIPVRDPGGKVLCVAGLWVHAAAFWRTLGASDALVGPGSYGLLIDRQGVRIAYTHDADSLYHPAGRLEPAVLAEMVAEGRFGPRTRALLEDVRPFPEQFERALATAPDTTVFSGLSPSNGKINYGVARRLRNVQWTVFYMVPKDNLDNLISSATRDKLGLALLIIGAALLAGLAFAASILRPVRELSSATGALSTGLTAVRVPVRGNDELSRLGASFNNMADRLHEQSEALRSANDMLEHRVRERTGLLNVIIDNSVAVIYVKDLQGRFLLVNQRFCTLFHREKEEVLGKSNHEIFDHATADAFREMDARVAQSAEPLLEEETAPHDDGVHTYLSVKCRLVDDEGRVYGIVGVSTDITERKQAHQKQLAQLERLNLLDQLSIAIGARQDLRSIYQTVIRELQDRMPLDICTICEYDPVTDSLLVSGSGALGASLVRDLSETGSGMARIPVGSNGLARCVRGELVYEPDMATSTHPLPRALAQAGFHSAVLAPLTAEGRVFGVLIATRRPQGAFSSGECEFLRQVSTHVALAAQQAQMTQQLQQAYDELRQSQHSLLQRERLIALGQMASGIAHDINNAITPAALYAETLLENEPSLSDEARRRLVIVARAIDDVAMTVARMREFYRHREPQVTMLPMDLNELAGQVLDLTRAGWSDIPHQRGVSISVHRELAPGLPAVRGVESEIREALTNLVLNALDAMPDGGDLTLRTRLDTIARCAVIEVVDTGAGMDAETRRRCIEPFFTTKGERGTGMGLAMVYGVAQRNDADIEIESEPGQGTSVRLRFPLPMEAAAPPPPVQGIPLLAPIHILVVDDDPLLLRSLHDSLRADGHTVTTALGGQAGCDALLAARFDAVITDLGMPDVDGRKVAAAAKAARADLPVVLLTGWGQRLDGEDALPPGVDRVLGKPPRLRELREVLRQLVQPGDADG